ncbi:hypothetical protein BDF14DRAFT_1742694 [Spinellus fusiger]|nr:hypothetical protein BDF14DRAFT_1742694 [Spinellus fusiger]
MPPKIKASKNEKKKTLKVADDKTFGMKNKNKSVKVQKYIQQVQGQAKANTTNAANKDKIAEKKIEEQKRKDELAELFKPVQTPQKVPFGTDPKTVICQYFKAGHCEKGNKCKFSHDLNSERKVQKKDMYTDSRALEDTMENWDQKKLEEVINSKSSKQPPTDIVCKHFLEAIENSKYGWFWECPNGGTECKYRHALPQGFILRSKKDKKDDKQEISLEEFLESERHRLGPNLTPVTLESFKLWKTNRQVKKDADEAAIRKQKETRYKAGRSQGMSGRDLFDFNPLLAADADDEAEAFDLSAFDRVEAEKERDRMEQERFLGHSLSHMSVQDTPAEVQVNEALFEEEDLDDLDE